ncbi:MAG: hypothetical protein JXQ65_05060 [Candidatus Marinimicrobia bacterium]|nr:hypothetical protein [Candidatus Neomarinimicrobiota bacterium]
MSIKGITGSINNIRDLDKNSKAKKGDAVKNTKSSELSKSAQTSIVSKDSVKISDFAKELLSNPTSVDSLKQELDNIKTLDRSTLKEIHAKIESNYYNKPEVIDKIVDGIIPEVHSTDAPEKLADTGNNERLQQIQQNIQNGKYDSDEVLDVIVEKMLNPENILS